jgi:hypothetical protein
MQTFRELRHRSTDPVRCKVQKFSVPMVGGFINNAKSDEVSRSNMDCMQRSGKSRCVGG